MEAIIQRSCGLDVHKKIIVGTVLLEQSDGCVVEETKEFGTTHQACLELSDWLLNHQIQLTVMETQH